MMIPPPHTPGGPTTERLEIRLDDMNGVDEVVAEDCLEVSSISNMGDNQSRPAQIRFKNKRGKNEKVHVLNGSALALPRLTLALEQLKPPGFPTHRNEGEE